MNHFSSTSPWLLSAAILLVMISCSLPLSPTVLSPTSTSTPGLTITQTATVLPTLTTQPDPTSTPVSQAEGKLIAYYATGSGSTGLPVANIPADQLDVLIYAFAHINPACECFMYNAGPDTAKSSALKELKKQHPKLKTLISISSDKNSARFSDIAASPVLQKAFARSSVALMKQYDFNGIDIDWEFPVSGGKYEFHNRPEDKQNFPAMLAVLRADLDRQGALDKTHYLLTITGGAYPDQIANLDLEAIYPLVDWIDVMAYAFAGMNNHTTGLKCPLFASTSDHSSYRSINNADAAITSYLSAGVPADKLVLGDALYGQGWQGVRSTHNGLFQPNDGPSQGTWANNGIYSYQDLVTNYLPTYLRTFDEGAQVPWLYNPKTGIFITYEDYQSLAAKANYVLANHLGGVAVWELGFDDDQHSLVSSLYSGLHSQNLP